MKNPKVSLFLIAILIVLAVLFTFSTEEKPEQHGFIGVIQTLKNKVAGQNTSQGISAKADQTEVTAPFPSVQTEQDERDRAEKFQQFKVFIQTEAQSLDNPKVNTAAKQAALIERASKLDGVEINYLKSTTLNSQQPINERILSVYLLSLATDSMSQNSVNEIAQAPLPDHGPSTPHSESELRNSQELALRYMAIDKLVQNYKSNPRDSAVALTALQDLKGHSTQNPIPQVRKYANDELNKIQTK